MKVVFDTNILISAFLTTTGPSEHIMRHAFKKHTVIISTYILHEFEKTLTHKLHVPAKLVNKAKDFLKRRAVFASAAKKSDIEFVDKKDIPILNLVLVAKPHYFVTGDKRMLAMKKLGSTLFVSPREAMEIL